MAFNVAEFRANMVGDGARPNLFAVTLVFPAIVTGGTEAGQKTTFMAKSSMLPGSTVNSITLPYFGRELKFSGNRTFAQWNITVINDEDFIIRNAMESWMGVLNSHAGNIRNPGAINSTSYSVDALVNQYGKAGNIIKSYKFVGLFPTDIAPIDLDWSSNDTIEDYSITFDYQYWTSNSTDS